MLLCEHNPVYTFGLRETEEHHLKSKELQKLGAQVFKVMVWWRIVYGSLFRKDSGLKILASFPGSPLTPGRAWEQGYEYPVENTKHQGFFSQVWVQSPIGMRVWRRLKYSVLLVGWVPTFCCLCFQTKRGGLTTFHGPGQLVCYPILNLRALKARTLSIVFNFKLKPYSNSRSSQLGVRQYVHCLEETAILTCAEFGIQTHTTEHTGVWVEGCKICAIGQSFLGAGL